MPSNKVYGDNWHQIETSYCVCASKQKRRFGQLDATIPLITCKVSTEQLKELEEDGIVFRESFNETPPRVEYSLTKKNWHCCQF